MALNVFEKNNRTVPPQSIINDLINLYNQGQFLVLDMQAQKLTKQFPKAFIVWNILGAANINLNRFEKASKAFKHVTELNPNYAEGHNNLGNALQDQGMLDLAIISYKKALSIKPNYVDAYSNMGVAFQHQGNFDKAISAFNKALLLNPNYAEVYNNLGNTLKDQNKLEKAVKAYNKSISLAPDYADTYINLGVVLQVQGKFNEALKTFKNYNSLRPNCAKGYENIGNVLKDIGELDQSITAYKKAVLLQPDYANAYINLGVVLQDQGKFSQSIAIYNKALLLKPNDAVIYNNMGNAFKNQGKFNDALASYKKALALKSDYAEAYNNMGNALKDQGILDGAIDCYKKSILLNPENAEVHQNLSFAFLNHGKLKEGLDEYEWRKKNPIFLSQQRYFLQPLWDGKKSLRGKRILIWCEQGIADTINWSSCLSHLASLASHCILECKEKLVPLLERSFPKIEVKAENRGLDLKRDDFDFHLPMGSLYKYFINEIIENNKIASYLIVDPVKVNFWREQLCSVGKGPYVGISWKSSNVSSNRIQNYAHISDWYPIIKIPNVNFINLQYKDFAGDLHQINDELNVMVHNFDDLDHFNNIDDVAALCKALDMVVSTKNTVPFISAGVGTLTKLANWRQSSWNNILLNPTTSSVEIYERNTWDPWNNTFRQIADDIFKLTKSSQNTRGSVLK